MGFQLEAGGTKREKRASVGAEKIWIKVTFGRALLRLGPRKLYLFLSSGGIRNFFPSSGGIRN